MPCKDYCPTGNSRDIAQRFGRFPHRNAILGRLNTTEEEAWPAIP
ncbi:MAG: DUF924 family protein [Gammaproteobacteria bacterium]